jgi:hypothetical protein
MNLDLIYSRPAKTAAQLATKAIDHHRFLAKKVLLTGETEILRTFNGRECFLVIDSKLGGSPAWIRTTIHGSKGRCPTIRRPGNSGRELRYQCIRWRACNV